MNEKENIVKNGICDKCKCLFLFYKKLRFYRTKMLRKDRTVAIQSSGWLETLAAVSCDFSGNLM